MEQPMTINDAMRIIKPFFDEWSTEEKKEAGRLDISLFGEFEQFNWQGKESIERCVIMRRMIFFIQKEGRIVEFLNKDLKEWAIKIKDKNVKKFTKFCRDVENANENDIEDLDNSFSSRKFLDFFRQTDESNIRAVYTKVPQFARKCNILSKLITVKFEDLNTKIFNSTIKSSNSYRMYIGGKKPISIDQTPRTKYLEERIDRLKAELKDKKNLYGLTLAYEYTKDNLS